MKVTIITATYNSSSTILSTLDSLNNQTYKNIEHIIVDGGSSDDTLELVRQHGERIYEVISEPDEGIYDALNKGIDLATGDLIGFLHSDDVLAYPSAISDLISQITLTGAQSIYADLEYVDKDDTNKVIRHWKSGGYDVNNFKRGWMPPHPTFFMERKLYMDLGGFDLSLKISSDYESMLRYLWKYRVTSTYLPKTLTKMRIGGISNRNVSNMLKKSREDISALIRYEIFWPYAIIIKNLSKIPQFFKSDKLR